jgi:hypothetical protein
LELYQLDSSVRDISERAAGFQFSRAKLTYFRFTLLAHFIPRAFRLKTYSPREIVNMQAGQCGIQIGTELFEYCGEILHIQAGQCVNQMGTEL